MDLHARKISFIQEFLKIQSEEVISHFEKLLKLESKNEQTTFTIDELNARFDKSMEDVKNRKYTEVEKLIAEIEKWD